MLIAMIKTKMMMRMKMEIEINVKDNRSKMIIIMITIKHDDNNRHSIHIQDCLAFVFSKS